MHPTVIFPPGDAGGRASAPVQAFDAIMGLGLALGGTITGEHGVGVLKREWLGRELGEAGPRAAARAQGAVRPAGPAQPGQGPARAERRPPGDALTDVGAARRGSAGPGRHRPARRGGPRRAPAGQPAAAGGRPGRRRPGQPADAARGREGAARQGRPARGAGPRHVRQPAGAVVGAGRRAARQPGPPWRAAAPGCSGGSWWRPAGWSRSGWPGWPPKRRTGGDLERLDGWSTLMRGDQRGAATSRRSPPPTAPSTRASCGRGGQPVPRRAVRADPRARAPGPGHHGPRGGAAGDGDRGARRDPGGRVAGDSPSRPARRWPSTSTRPTGRSWTAPLDEPAPSSGVRRPSCRRP